MKRTAFFAGAVLLIMAMGTSFAALQASFDPSSGAWTGLNVNGRSLISRGTDVEIRWRGGSLPPVSSWKLVSIQKRQGITTVTRDAGDWRIRTETAQKGDELRRHAIFERLGAKEAVVTGTSLILPNLRISASPNDYYLIPSCYPITKHRFGSLHPGNVSSESWWLFGKYDIAAIHSPSASQSILVSYDFLMDGADTKVEESTGSISVRQDFYSSAIVKPGQSIDCGTQVIRFVQGDEKRMLSAMSALASDTVGGPPADRAASLKKCVLCEVQPWGRLESWDDPDRGNRYPRLTKLVPYYKDIGVNTLWLLPVSCHPPWVYNLPAFDCIDPQNGTPEELHSLIDTVHRNSMKMLIDLVVYGISPSSKDVDSLPESCWCYDEGGNRVRVWGGSVLAADCSNPDWQKEISGVVHHWSNDFGFDGTRLDCQGWGQIDNWKNPMRTNAAVAYGGLQLNKVIRDSMRKKEGSAIILPEGSLPVLFRNSDLIFGYPLYMHMREMTTTPDLRAWIRNTQEWLEWERHSYPASGLPGIVRFLENHDTVSAGEYFGVGPSQALMAICILMQGTPMLYQEQETGFSRDFKAWVTLRNREGCFYDGTADYAAVKSSSPDLFCFLRSGKDGAAIVAVNMTGKDVTSRLSWPEQLSRRFPAIWDLSLGKKIPTGNQGSVVVPAYRPAVFLLKSKTAPAPGRYILANGHASGTPLKEASSLSVTDAKRWFVDTPEGYLEDRFTPLSARLLPGESAVDALPVLRRAWNPLKSALLDGGSRASVGFIMENGARRGISIDPQTVSDVRIVDPEADGRSAAIVVKETGDVRSRPISKMVSITPQFVFLDTGKGVLNLSRRQGGLPISLADGGKNRLLGMGNLFTDEGLFDGDKYGSADGETNPRMLITSRDSDSTIEFTGRLRSRSWNGIQTCSPAAPAADYRIVYQLEGGGRLRIGFGVKPSQSRKTSEAVVKFELPFEKVTEERVLPDGTLELKTPSGTIRIRPETNLRLTFSPGGKVVMTLTVGGGEVKAGSEVYGSAEIML